MAWIWQYPELTASNEKYNLIVKHRYFFPINYSFVDVESKFVLGSEYNLGPLLLAGIS